MDKLKMHTKSKVDVNIESIGALFPNTVTETIKGYDEDDNPIIEKAIDFDILKQELSKVIVKGREERYQMNWPGKKEAILTANAPINKTLRPCRADSVKFDETENLYIEGDNLEVLKLLQETYLNRVKMIYIDPPYNTGNDSFVYNDNFAMSNEEFSEVSGQYDEDGNINYDIRENNKSNGRFHTNWLNMMYPRLKLAKDLLKDDGVIFISIDDREVSNLKKVCDEILGEENFITNIIWQKKFARQNDATYFSTMHDNILCYAKRVKSNKNDNDGFNMNLLPRTDEDNVNYKNPDNDERGKWISVDFSAKSGNEKLRYEIVTPAGERYFPAEGRYWSTSKENFEKLKKDNRIWFGSDGKNRPRIKTFLTEVQNGMIPNSIWFYDEVGHTQSSKQYLKKLFDNKAIFDTPKPVELIYRILYLSTNENDIVLDFFLL